MKVTCHCIVKNEEKWIWYSLMSVLDYVDEIDIIDTGSVDNTVKIISTINSKKIKLSQIRCNSPEELTKLRHSQLERTNTDWVLILDGDEIWPESAINASLIAIEKNRSIEFLISSSKNFVGDIFHYLPENAGRYKIGQYQGHLNLRWFNAKIPGLRFKGQINNEWLEDGQGHRIDQKQPSTGMYISEPYLHCTHLVRSTQQNSLLHRQRNYKYDLGIPMPMDYTYPKYFYLPRPHIVPSPWKKRSFIYVLNATWQTPLKALKRSLMYA